MVSPNRRRRDRSRSPQRREEGYHDHRRRRYRESEGDYGRRSKQPSTSSHQERRHQQAFRKEQNTSSRERRRDRTDRERSQRGSPQRDDRSHHQRSEQNSQSETAEQNIDGPNYNLSGKLTEYTNTYKGVVIKYNEPPEARKPKTRWRLYPFKGEEAMSVMYIHRQSAYLLGRQRHIVDIAIDHPSCSKQHAVLQYRLVDHTKTDGTVGRKVKPYIIDLESINGTYLNNQRVEPRRFYELKEKDVLKFGFSTREYVILTEKSQDSDDDEPEPGNEEG
ncbi:smad nuclear-interacting protein 1-like [Porites lutea]|uniref:smad nuclear-interacting protein 1-like n=1 Tax=Porites lutea TaxID=51062 RepID=UPI003CC5A587